MIIISEYTLIFKRELNIFLVESNFTTHICPLCQNTLVYRDSRLRICKKEAGEKTHLRIRRFYCKSCKTHHNELPDCLLPYKHYETQVISGVLDDIVKQDDLDSEDYPSSKTMCRWLEWFSKNLERLKGYLRLAATYILEFEEESFSHSSCLFSHIRKKYKNWLEISMRFIYNSGGFLVPL